MSESFPILERLRGRTIHLVGFSGLEIADVAVFLHERGIRDLIGHDLSSAQQLPQSFRAAHIGISKAERERHWDRLRACEVELRLDDDYLQGINTAEIAIVTQAWRLYERNAPLEAAVEAGLALLTPMEIYLALARSLGLRTVGVTGSNGKSTTANMILHTLRAAGRRAALAGNYRYRGPTLEATSRLGSDGVLVLEISNHHLMALTETVDVAVVTNVTANHLEEHDGFAGYLAVKRKLVEGQPVGSVSILNRDDVASWAFRHDARGAVQSFGKDEVGPVSANLRRDSGIALHLDRGLTEILPSGLRVPGDHNRENAMAAALACVAVGLSPSEVESGLADFAGIPGRIERVRSVAGVDVYDDIESTTPDSTCRALEAFAGREIHLIAGGDNKGLDYKPLLDAIAATGASLYLVEGGSATTSMLTDAAAREGQSDSVDYQPVDNLESALRTAFGYCGAGAVILLSPAAKGFYNRNLRGNVSFNRLAKRLRASERGKNRVAGSDAD